MKKFSAILSLSVMAALPMSNASADPTPKKQSANPCSIFFKAKGRAPANDPCSMAGGPIEELIAKIKSMPVDQKIREAFLALTLPMPIGPLTALLDAYAVEKSEQKRLELKAKIEDLLKKFKIGKYATGEMMKKPAGAYLYQSKVYKPVAAQAIKGADEGKAEKKEEKKVQTVQTAVKAG